MNSSSIRKISDTAYWVAMCRAIESERVDALFYDKHALSLAGVRGRSILQELPLANTMTWPVVIRTFIIDNIISRCIELGTSTVLNFAAGLDTRAFRLSLHKNVEWFDIDLPEIRAHRLEHMHSSIAQCRYHLLEKDLSEAGAVEELFSEISFSGNTLAITEGFLAYLTEDQVVKFSEQLHASSNIRWWIIDLMSPHLLRLLSQNWDNTLFSANAGMQFSPSEGGIFFEKLGWKVIETRSVWSEAVRLKRLASSLNLTSKMLQTYRCMSTVVLLERVPTKTKKLHF